MLNDATLSVVETNHVFSLTGASIVNFSGPGNNTVSKNTLADGDCGLVLGKTDKNTVITQNTYVNTTVTVCRQ